MQKLLYLNLVLLCSIFNNITPMDQCFKNQDYNDQKSNYSEQNYVLSDMPVEIKLYILEQGIKNIIEDNSVNVIKAFDNISKYLKNIFLVNKKFKSLKYDLIKFTKKYLVDYFCKLYINLTQKEKDKKLKDIFESRHYNQNLEVEAAKLLITGANPNLIVRYTRYIKHHVYGDDYYENYNTPILIVISETGRFESLINLLISFKVNINAKGKYDNTALMRAIEHGNKKIVKLLLNCKDIDITSKTKYGGLTALNLANQKCWGDIAELILKLSKSSSDNPNPNLMGQCFEHQGYNNQESNNTEQNYTFSGIPIEIKLYILEQGIKNIIEDNSVNIIEAFDNISRYLKNIFLVNKEFKNLNYTLTKSTKTYLIDYFCKPYIDLTQKEKDKKLKAIIESHYSQNLEIEAAKLIIIGANPDLLTTSFRFFNHTTYGDYYEVSNNMPIIIFIAKTNRFKNLINLLISSKVNVNAKASDNNTALIYAIRYGHIEIAKSLLKCKDINVNSKDDFGATALTHAIHRGWVDIAEIILKLSKI